MPIYPFKEILPEIAGDAWVAPTAVVIGDTKIGARSNIWFGAVLRGDVHFIRVGSLTNIQDNAVVHVTTAKFPCIIGDRVTVGHGAIVHACTVGDGALVGMGSVVLDGAVVEAGAMVAAGAVVAPGKRVPTGWLWSGVPAKPMREMTEGERAYLEWSASHYAGLAESYRG